VVPITQILIIPVYFLYSFCTKRHKNELQIFPEIKSERLLLRKIEESDDAVILYLRSDETINQYIERPENRKTKTIAQALQFINEITQDYQ
jgi:hypothetical protein